jgi:hypothetical protein
VSHSTLSGVVSGRRPASARFVLRIASRLGLEAGRPRRSSSESTRRKLAAQVVREGFRPDLRDLAMRSGISVDALCIALHRLLSERRLNMTSAQCGRCEETP